jgi:hypothetical protein
VEIQMYDPVDSLALIEIAAEIAAAPHLQAAKIDLTLDRDFLLASCLGSSLAVGPC